MSGRDRRRAQAGASEARVAEPAWYPIVLSWNGREDTVSCLDAITKVSEPRVRVVCVDNGSTDGSVKAIHDRHPEMHLIENAWNLGFAGGCNVGIRWALAQGAEWVVLLNNDAVIAPDAIAEFAAAAEQCPEAGVLAGKLYHADRPYRVWYAGNRFLPWLGYSGRHRGEGRRDRPRYRRASPTDRANGALMAISRAAIESVGMLDEQLFAYVEDIDFSVRARAAGFEVLFVPAARAWHRVGASSAATAHNSYYGTRNMVVVCERHRPLPRPLSRLRRGIILASFTLYALRQPNRSAALAAVRAGYRDARAGRLGPRP
jgi:GT2 family glycosyltransferase